MTPVSRLPRLTVGDQVSLDGSVFTVTALTGDAVALTDVTGQVSSVPVATMLADATFTVLAPARTRAPLPNRGVLDGLPAQVIARAQWWEQHVIEVLTGTSPSSCGDTPRPVHDPLSRSLRQRELDKVAELQAAGEQVSLTTLRRMSVPT